MYDEAGPSKVKVMDASNILVHNKLENYESINLMNLVYTKGWFIIYITAICTILAIGCTFFLKPHYKITTLLVEPKIEAYKDIFLNTRSDITQADLFTLFLKKLSDIQNFNSFLKQSSEIDNTFQISSDINNSLKSKVIINHNDPVEAELTIISPQLDANADLNKAYISFTNKKTLSEFIKKQHDAVNIKIKKIKEKISVIIDTLKNQQTFFIDRLKNQIAILKTKKNNKENQQYLLHLENELYKHQYNIDALDLNHKSGNNYLVELKLQLQLLESLSFKLPNVSSYEIKNLSTVGSIMISKKLVIMLGFFLGLILALTISILQTIFQVRKELKLSMTLNSPDFEAEKVSSQS